MLLGYYKLLDCHVIDLTSIIQIIILVIFAALLKLVIILGKIHNYLCM